MVNDNGDKIFAISEIPKAAGFWSIYPFLGLIIAITLSSS